MRLPLVLATTVALVLPAGASAKTKYYIPPGNSSGSEYVESVPTAGGNAPTSKIGGGPGGGSVSGGGGGGGGGAVSHQTQSALKKYGTVGAQTAAFASATAPAQAAQAAQGPARSGRTAGGGSTASGGGPAVGGGAAGRAADAPAGGSGGSGGGANSGTGHGTPAGDASSTGGSGGSSPVISVARSVTGLGAHSGFGLLPLVLILTALGIGAIALRRRHAS